MPISSRIQPTVNLIDIPDPVIVTEMTIGENREENMTGTTGVGATTIVTENPENGGNVAMTVATIVVARVGVIIHSIL